MGENPNHHKFHFAAWDSLSKPKALGGWGIKQLGAFNIALCAKSMWRCLTNNGLWGSVIKAKYLKRLPMVYWFRSRHQNLTNGSLLWRGLIKSYPIINQYICWLPSRGTHIFLGTDAIIGLSEGYKLTK